jgi:hypothetical protein
MKSLKLALGAVLAVAVIGASFAFTTKTKKVAPAAFFRYIGPASFTQSDLLTSANWQPLSAFAAVDHSPVIVAEIEIKQNSATYVDDQGTASITDDVLLIPTALQSDLTKAGGFAPSPNNFIQEVSVADYEILNNSTKL